MTYEFLVSLEHLFPFLKQTLPVKLIMTTKTTKQITDDIINSKIFKNKQKATV